MKKRKDGRYTHRVTLPDGTSKDVYGKSIPEVNAMVKALLKEAETGVKLDDHTTVGEWAEQWRDTYKATLRAHTKMGYTNAWNNHIRPYLDTKPLKAVLPVDVKTVMNAISDKSEDLQRKVLNTMRQMFDTAIQNRLMAMNPCSGIKITPHAKSKRIKVLSPDQQDELILKVTDSRARLFCKLGIYAGLRREEILGLQWSDIKDGKITVNRAVTFLKNQQDENHELKSDAAHRSIPIPTPLSVILDQYPHNGIYLITNSKGGEMTLMAYRNLWAHVTKTVDFDVHAHMLRHSYATSLYRAGVDLKTAQYLLGHADIKMTAEIYTHIANEQIDEAAIKIQSIFSPQSKLSQTDIK